MTIASQISRLQLAKSCIKTAIENKGVSVSSSLKLDNYYSCIAAIPSAVYLTQAEYDALPSSKLTDGIPYVIMDSGSIVCIIINGENYNPKELYIDYLLVGGGGGGGNGGGGGGGGEVLLGSTQVKIGTSFQISIGAGGNGGSGRNSGGTGGDTVIGDIECARGGQGGYSQYCGGTLGCTGGSSGNGCTGGSGLGGEVYAGGGGGGAGGNGSNACSGSKGGAGGIGLCGYAGGGGGGGSNGAGCGACGGGNGVTSGSGKNATQYGSGGGGAFSIYQSGGAGCQGLVEICYKTDGSCGFTAATGGNCCYTCNGYKVHRFTSNGTFTIVS